MQETRWLTEDEQGVWRAYLSMTQAIRKATMRQLAQDSDLPHTYYEILVHLSEAPGRTLRMSELAAATEGTQSQLSHAVNRLEERGWVERRKCETDGRGLNAILTDAGFATLAEAAPGHVECVRTVLFDALTPEQQQQLRSVADAVVAHNTPRGRADGGIGEH